MCTCTCFHSCNMCIKLSVLRKWNIVIIISIWNTRDIECKNVRRSLASAEERFIYTDHFNVEVDKKTNIDLHFLKNTCAREGYQLVWNEPMHSGKITTYITTSLSWWCHQMETFPRHWSFVRGIHRWSVVSTHKGQWRGTEMFFFDLRLKNGCANNRVDGDLRRHRAHYVSR